MILSHVIRVWRTWRRYRACVRELSQLSDLELTDLGLTRSGIISVALRTAQETPLRTESVPPSRVDVSSDH